MTQVANLKSILKQASGLSTTPKSVVKPPISKQVKVLAGTSSQKALSIENYELDQLSVFFHTHKETQ